MLPILYQKDGITKKGILEDCFTANVHERRNADFELLLSYPIGYPLFKDIRVGDVIEAHANDKLRNQKFRIYNVQKFLKTRIMIRCRHISFDSAFDKVDSISLTNASCEYALNEIFRNSIFSQHMRGFSDIKNAQDYNMVNESVQRAIVGAKGSVIDTYAVGAEILRDNNNIHVLEHRGRDNGVVIAYGDNLTGFDAMEDDTKVLTRVRGFVKKHIDGQETIIYGDYIISDKEDLYPHPKIQDMDYTSRFTSDEVPTKDKLNEFARDEFKVNKVDIPKITYKAEFIPLSKCVGYEDIEDRIGLCDIVTIKNKVYDLETKAKVVKYNFNCLTDRYESIEIGDIQTSFNIVIGGIGGNNGLTESDVKDIINQNPSTNYPDLLPSTPVLSGKIYGFDSLELSWTFEQQPYLNYEVYGSRTRNFTPTQIDLLYRGQASTYTYKTKPGEKWYFKVCAVNTKASRTPFSNEVELESRKVDDLENYFSSAAIGKAVVGSLTADYMEAGIIKANWVEFKGGSVVDGNGKRTFDIDSFGRITLMPSVFKMLIDGKEENIVTESRFEANNESINMKFGKTGGTNEILNSKCTNSRDYMYTGGHTGSPVVDLHVGKPGIQFTVKPYGSAGGFQTSAWSVIEGEKHTLAFDYSFERAMESYCEIHFYTTKHEGFGVWPDVKKEVISLDNSGSVNHTVTIPAKAKYMKIYIYTSYNGVDSGKYPYAHAYVNELRCFKSEIAGPWVPASDEMYAANIKFNGKGIEQTYNNEYKSRWGADALEFLTPNNIRKLAIDRSQFCTYNFDDGNFLSYIGATKHASYSKIFGNSVNTSRHCAFFDVAHNPNIVDDSLPINFLNSYFRVNFFAFDDQVAGTHIGKYPLFVHHNLEVDRNLKVTQDLQVWGDIRCESVLNAKKILCTSGIDMRNMSIENVYATKYGPGTSSIVKGNGKVLELGGLSAGDYGGTKIGCATSAGDIQPAIWISAPSFVWNYADWNWGGHNIYDVHIYASFALDSEEARLLKDTPHAVVKEDTLYVNPVKSCVELVKENNKLKEEQETQNQEIVTNMLANTEMFEMMLGMMPQTFNNRSNGGNENMVEVYVTLIIKGVKKIEDVPAIIRPQVIERLKQLEVQI